MTRLLQVLPGSPPAVPTRGRVALATLGCKLNQAESDALAREFQAIGYQIVDPRQPADVFVLNSCTVTQEADRKARQALRRARRLNPTALTVLTGCYPSVSPDVAARQSGADLILGNRDKAELVATVDRQRGRSAPASAEPSAATAPTGRPVGRTRAFVKIQDGCNDYCAFCIVPTARGRSVSRPPAEIIAEVAERAAEGVREVVLTGVQIGWYGRDSGLRRQGGWDLAALLTGILRETSLERLRLTSIHPRDVTPALIEVLADRRVCPHLHMSLQSGSERVLDLMQRRSTPADYLAKVAAIRARIPELAFTTDLIVGFPGETEADFAATQAVARAAGFAQIHVFPFSARAGTVAARLPDPVAEPVKAERAKILRDLAEELTADFQRRLLGQTRPVLFESPAGAGRWTGLTDNYQRVELVASADLRNQLRPVELVSVLAGTLIGRLAD